MRRTKRPLRPSFAASSDGFFFWFLGFFSEAHSTVAHAVMASMASSPSPSIFSLAM